MTPERYRLAVAEIAGGLFENILDGLIPKQRRPNHLDPSPAERVEAAVETAVERAKELLAAAGIEEPPETSDGLSCQKRGAHAIEGQRAQGVIASETAEAPGNTPGRGVPGAFGFLRLYNEERSEVLRLALPVPGRRIWSAPAHHQCVRVGHVEVDIHTDTLVEWSPWIDGQRHALSETEYSDEKKEGYALALDHLAEMLGFVSPRSAVCAGGPGS